MSYTYDGYRIKIGNTIISNDLIQKGSYQFQKAKRMASNWNDAAIVEHQSITDNRKVIIQFNLRERDLNEQDSIKGIFSTQENIKCKYWDDYACEYKETWFYMDAPQIQHRNTIGGINYSPTTIKLTEY